MSTTLDNFIGDQRYRFASVVFLALIIMFTKLEGNGLATWDDCFYAQKAKELQETNSWMTMHYAGQPAFENPPMFIWLIALSYKIWGVSEYAAIFPSALFGVLCIVLVYLFARELFDSWAAFFSSVVLLTTFYFTKYARHAMIDVSLTFFVTLALFALVRALRRDPRYFLLWGLAISVSVLLKSVLGLFPMLITIAFLLASGRWKMLFNLWFLTGSSLVLVLGCSWYAHQYLTFGRVFIDAHFGWVIMTRGFALEPEPWYAHLSYLEDLGRYYWLWLPVFCWSLYRFVRLALRKDDNALLLTSWILLYLIVMSITQSRMFWYIMPIFSASAMICGFTLRDWVKERARVRVARRTLLAGIAIVLLIDLTPLRLSRVREQDVRTIAPYVKHLAGQNVKLIAFRYSFHSLNNPLLFYSDNAARYIYMTYDELATQFADTTALMCVAKAEDLDSLFVHIPNAHVLRKTDGASLISNRTFDVTNVRTW